MKPGYKTTEFWMSAIAIIFGGVLAAGVIPTEGTWAQIFGAVQAGLVSLGYTGARMTLKKAVSTVE